MDCDEGWLTCFILPSFLYFLLRARQVLCMPFLPIGFFSLSPLAFFFCLFFVSSIVHLDGFLFYGLFGASAYQ